jgi:DNA polymerase III subunit alpha
MGDLFGGVEQGRVETPRLRDIAPLSTRERLEGEKESLGLYLTGHPIEDYLDELRHICGTDIARLRARRGNQLVAGLVVSLRTMRSRRGGDICFLTIDDRSGRIEASLFSEAYESQRGKITKDAILVIEGEVQPDDFTGALKLRGERVYTMAEARQRFGGGVLLDLCAIPEAGMPGDLPSRLRACLEPHRSQRAGCPVECSIRRPRLAASARAAGSVSGRSGRSIPATTCWSGCGQNSVRDG